MTKLKSVIEILKLLNKSNCGECHEKTCLAFATAVFKGVKQLEDCPYLEKDVIQQYGGNIEKMKTLEEDQDKVVAQLKQEVMKTDLAKAAENIGGIYTNNRLTVKIFGKDFSIDTSGKIITELHVNPYITIPFLLHILYSKGIPVSGKWVRIRELSYGQSLHVWFEQRCEMPIKRVADIYTDLFIDLIHIFNGKEVGNFSQADIALELHLFPKVPILVCYWKTEEGMASEFKLFFDRSVDDHLPIEGLYGLGSGLVRMFERIAQHHGG